jgi:hypothetical protein
MQDLRGVNIARFTNTMTRLCPDEEEVFSKAYLIDGADIQKSPYFLVLVEAVGAPDSEEFSDADRAAFDAFMDGHLKEGEPDPALKEPFPNKQKARRVRDTYMVIETTHRELRGKPACLPRRVLIIPPCKRKAGRRGQMDRIDMVYTDRFRSMLDDTMMWSRSRIVCMANGQVKSI